MKSRNSGPSRRLLLVNSVLLLLANCFILAQSDAIDLTSWISTEKGKWPKNEAGDKAETIYVHHHDLTKESGKLFGVKKDFFEHTDLASKWNLKFKYATTTDSDRLRTVDSNKRVVNQLNLDKTIVGGDLDWKETITAIVGTTKDEFHNSNFISQDDSILALKDVTVEYLEKLAAASLEVSPVHQYRSSGGVKNFADLKSQDEQIKKDSPSTVYYGAKGQDVIIELTDKPESAKVQLKILSETTVASLEFKPKADYTDCAAPAGLPADITIKCKVDTPTKKIVSITISTASVTKKFAIWNIDAKSKVTYGTDISARDVYIASEVKEKTEISYVSFTGSQPKDQDACYDVQVSDATLNVDVFLTLENLNSGIKLTSFKNEQKVCLNQYVALRNLKNYQVTLAITGVIKKDTLLVVTTSTPSTKLTFAKFTKADFTAEILSSDWYYYNSILFDYTITGLFANLEVPKGIAVCDVVANCFELTSVEVAATGADATTKKVVTLTIDDGYKKVLESSPFVRFQGNIKGLSFVKSAVVGTAEAFKKKFEEQNKGVVSDVTYDNKNKITAKISTFTNNLAEIKISGESFDFRVHQLGAMIEFKGTKPEDTETRLNLIQFSYNSSNPGENPYHFPDTPIPDKFNIKIDKFSLASDHLFQVVPTQLQSTTKDKALSVTVQRLLKANVNPVPTVELTFEVLDKPTQPAPVSYKDLKDQKADTTTIHTSGNGEIKQQNSGFVLTKWINAAADPTFSIQKTNLKATVKITSSDPFQNDPFIIRAILGQGNPVLATVLPGTYDTGKKIYTFIDDITAEQNSAVREMIPNGPFRVAYLIHSRETKPIKFELTEFIIQSPKLPDSNCDVGATIATQNCNYEKAAGASSFKLSDDSSKYQLDYLYHPAIKRCDEKIGCSNIFDQPLLTTKLGPTATADKVQYFPYLSSAADQDKINYLQVNKPSIVTTDDFCVTVNYMALDTHLLVGTNESVQSIFYNTLPNVNKADAKLKEKICASQLTNEPKGVKALYFKFDKTAPINSDVNYILGLPAVEKYNDEKFEFQEGIYWDNKPAPKNATFVFYQEQIIIETSTESFWAFEEKFDPRDTNALRFLIDLAQIDDLKAKYGDKFVLVDNLWTKWIKAPKSNGQLVRLGLSVEGDSVQKWKDLFDLTASVSSSNQLAIDTKSKADLLGGKIVAFNLKNKADFYKINFQVTIDLSKFDEEASKTFDLISFRLAYLSVNDPCVDDQNQVKVCTSEKAGYCSRQYDDFKNECICNTGFEHGTKKECEKQDFCADKKAIKCGGKDKCENDETLKQFRCKCTDKQFWDSVNQLCVEQSALTECKEEHKIFKNGKCQCIDGFVLVNKTCTTYEPCNAQHRKEVAGTSLPPCADKNAECKPTGTGQDDYYCQCKGDFINEHGFTARTANCLPKVCATCDSVQKCDKNVKGEYECQCVKGYTVKDGKCTADFTLDPKKCKQDKPVPHMPEPFQTAVDTCACITGFDYKTVPNRCESNLVFTKSIGCGDNGAVELKSDNSVGCKCAENQKFDLTTRKCVNECSDEFKAICTAKKANCGQNEKSKKYQCACAVGDIPYSTNSSDVEAWNCVSICDGLITLPEQYNARCDGTFAHCVPDNTKITLINNPKIEKSKINDAEVFLFKYTKIDTSQSEYCACDFGFVPDTKHGGSTVNNFTCEPSSTPTHTITGMEFAIDPAKANDKVYITKIENAFKKLIWAIIGLNKLTDLHDTLCTPSGALVKCSTSFESKLEDALIGEKLKAACVPFPDDKTKCVYIKPNRKETDPPPTPSRRKRQTNTAVFADDEEQLIAPTPSKPIVSETRQFCQADSCAKNAFTKCHTKNIPGVANTLFECTCEEEEFIELDHYVAVGSHDLRMETCRIKNMCHDTKSPGKYGCINATCHFQVDGHSGAYVPQTFCSCPETGFTLPSQKLSCNEWIACNGRCGQNSDGCAYDDRRKEGPKLTCHCKESWSGDDCTKTSEAAKESKGYMIATIVVSVIAAIALIGVAVLFFRSRR